MSVQDNPGNIWPSSLDLNDWFGFSLREKDEISRRIVLEEFSVNGLPKQFQGQVREIADKDPSFLCQEIASYLLYLESNRSETELLPNRLETTPQSMHDLLETAQVLFRKAVLRVVWRPPSPELLDIWRDRLLSEDLPEVVAIGLSLLAKYGNPSDSRFAGAFFDSGSPDVVKAAIDLLFHQDLETLKQRMAGILTHQNLDIRFHAMRRLVSIDLKESLQYLNHAIEGDDPFVRRRAIQELALIPLKDVEPSYVKILGLETQPLLLAMAGSTLASNPKPDLPPLVYDIILMSKGIKKHILELILRQVVDSIKAAGIIKGSIEDYLKALHQELQSRRADLIVALALRDLRHQELEIRKQAFEKLLPFAAETRVQKAFRTRIKLETDTDLLNRLKPFSEEPEQSVLQSELSRKKAQETQNFGLMTEPSPTPPATDGVVSAFRHDVELLADPPALKTGGKLTDSRITKQLSLISGISNREDFIKERGNLLRIIETASNPPSWDKSKQTGPQKDAAEDKRSSNGAKDTENDGSERLTAIKALRCFDSFGNSGDVDSLLPFLKSRDSSIVGQTLRIIARLDFEKIAIAVNPLLRDENLAIKAAALEVYITCDKDGALQYLKSMLLSPVAAVRRKALTLAPLLDFASIETILLNILQKDPHPDIQSQTGFILASNPTEAGLKAVFRHTHPIRGNPGAEIIELWDIARPAAVNFFSCPPDKVDSVMEALVAKDESLQTAAGPSYAFKKVVDQESGGYGLSSAKTTAVDFFSSHRENFAGLVVCAIIYLIMSYIDLPPLPASISYRREFAPSLGAQDKTSMTFSKATPGNTGGTKDGAWTILNEAPIKEMGSPTKNLEAK